MITRPTTEELIADCCRELTEVILPGLTDETLQVRLVMTETVLRNAGVRAAHEIAWMREETADLAAFAQSVPAGERSPELAAALSRVEHAPRDSLHLDDVVETYNRAGEAFAVAMEDAETAGNADQVEHGRRMLRSRVAREKVVMATYQIVGR